MDRRGVELKTTTAVQAGLFKVERFAATCLTNG